MDMNKVKEFKIDENLAKNDQISNVSSKFALTTEDNPYNPFSQYRDWLLFDEQNGYCSNSYLARIANLSESLSHVEYNEEVERAIDEILSYDLTKNFVKAVNLDYKEPY